MFSDPSAPKTHEIRLLANTETGENLQKKKVNHNQKVKQKGKTHTKRFLVAFSTQDKQNKFSSVR